jgi:5-methylcytosine-specific restriction endonuclease McrA
MYMKDRGGKSASTLWHRKKAEEDPAWYEECKRKARERIKRWKQKLKKEDPAAWKKYLAERRAYEKSPETKVLRSAARRLRKFGLTDAEYNRMLQRQGHACAICGSKETRGPWRDHHKWPIDHDHKTGAVRGLLCHICNMALGLIDDNVNTLRRMIRYLEVAARKSKRRK